MVRSLVVLATLGAVASAARADDAPATLAWHADPGCGSVDVLRARIAAHLGRPLTAADHVSALVEVVRAPLEADVRAHLRIATASGARERDVRGADCGAVVEAVAFVLASAVGDEPPAPPAPPAVTPPSAVLGRGAPVVATPRPAQVRAHLRVDGWSDKGSLGEFRYGLGGTLAVSYARARLEVGSIWWRPDWPGDDAAAGATLREYDVRGCAGVWEVWACGGALVGTVTSDGQPDRRWSGVSALVRWTRPIGQHLALAASVEAIAALDRPLLEGVGGDRASPAALRLGLAVEAIVP
ncbi:MAG: hypothetical protein IPH80_33105 [Myxococcales bacterium]|nr:hypothetical protein [Myxococcales bacterium]MBP6849422.1 hypothetical protein [Kofleriaceae bacterium]